MGQSVLERARDCREFVLWAELGAWLHDLGKLSSAFVLDKSGLDRAYGPAADASAVGEESSPSWKHDQVLAHDDAQLPAILKEALNRPVRQVKGRPAPDSDAFADSQALSLRDLISGHHGNERKTPELLLRLLIAADHADSGEDEYQAVSLRQMAPVQAATVFGREEPLAGGEPASLDVTRRALYAPLAALLGDGRALADKREEIWDLLQGAMARGLGKTQRAANDVRLHQHTWGVAARFRAFVLRHLLNPPIQDEAPHTFRILSVCWNAWEAITPYARLSDVVGRVEMLRRLRSELRRDIEVLFALGARIYEDDDGVHFLVADLSMEDDLRGLIARRVNERTGGEVQTIVRLSQPTERVTLLAAQMDECRRSLPEAGQASWASQWHTGSQQESLEVCPVCQRRPLRLGRELCAWCAEWRGKGLGARLGQGTLWTGEIGAERGRVALIVARFGLQRWLDGSMLHTLFITSPQDLSTVPTDPKLARQVTPIPVQSWAELGAALREITPELLEPLALHGAPATAQGDAIVKREQALRTWGRDASRINSPAGQAARWLGAVFGRLPRAALEAQDLQHSYGLSPNDALLLALVRKNLSAARLLRVWQSTEAFLAAQAAALAGQARTHWRVVLRLSVPAKGTEALEAGIYKAEAPGVGRSDIYLHPGGAGERTAQTIEGLTDGQIARWRAAGSLALIADDENHPIEEILCPIREATLESYASYQVISASPTLLLAMVPAEAAMDAAEALREAYVAEFAKVQGRLPFHVGLIYMDAHYPMFAALDAARRLGESFDRLSDRPGQATVRGCTEDGGRYNVALHDARYGDWTWEIPALLGNGPSGSSVALEGQSLTDWYHPYFCLQEGGDLGARDMSLVGPEGRWVHVSQLREGDHIAVWPSLFDFMHLDTASQRLQAYLAPGGDRRNHALLGPRHSLRPYHMERCPQLRQIWEALCCAGVTDTQLAAAVALLAGRWKAWGLAESDDAQLWQTYLWFAGEVAARHGGGDPLIAQAMREGTIFDADELYRHILKRRLERPRPRERWQE